MSRYRYIALNQDGQEVEGLLEAQGVRDVVSLLRQKELIPISIRTIKENRSFISIAGQHGISLKDLSIFCRQYASLLQAGVPSVQALNLLAHQTHNLSLKQALQKVYYLVQGGHSLSEAMLNQENRFPNILIRTIESGEGVGTLDVSFKRMAEYFERQYRIKQKVRKALAYPSLLIVTSIIIVIFLVRIVVPQFVTLFHSSQVQLPKSTQLLIRLYDMFVHNTWLILIVPAVFYLIVKTLKSSEKSRIFLGGIILKTPLIGDLIIKVLSASFYRTMSILVSAGLPLTQSLSISSKITNNTFIINKLQLALAMVYQGKGIAKSLSTLGIFPQETINIIAVGEESGEIGEMMDKIADLCELEAETTIDRFISLLEPLSILFLGGIIAYIVISVVLPMFNMYVFY
ncbi:MAG: type II secretion system F family protein [Caldicoprobacterales bacterium]|jgi:type IV pilus assembly protein PilC